MSSAVETREPSLVKRELAKAKEIVIDETAAAASLAKEAARSGSYLYPLFGISYFFSHPAFLQLIRPVATQCVTLSVAVIVLMFFFTYLPQVALLAFVSGPFAILAAVPAVLLESSVVIKFIARTFLLKGIESKLFDAVILERGHEELLASGRSFSTTGSGAKVLGKRLIGPVTNRFSTEGLLRYLLTLPINAIPALGTALFLFLNGETAGPSAHARYFQLKGFSAQEKEEWVKNHSGAYTAFGMVTVAMAAIPVVGILFNFSNAVGAALWASDLENGLTQKADKTPAKAMEFSQATGEL